MIVWNIWCFCGFWLFNYLPDDIHVKYQNWNNNKNEIKCPIFWTTFKSRVTNMTISPFYHLNRILHSTKSSQLHLACLFREKLSAVKWHISQDYYYKYLWQMAPYTGLQKPVVPLWNSLLPSRHMEDFS